ncbi:MAG: cbb3-type cytochrome c oxidase subunit I [Chitinophagaceae bacterium]|nr:cbb3-type cytochrome c oxidase subunit I [Chitinophagaceae bacterium]
MMKSKAPLLFIITAIASLITAISFGIIATLQYVQFDFLKPFLTFNKVRPMHVTGALSWVLLSAIGGIYYYLQKDGLLKKQLLVSYHFIIFLLTGIGIYTCYALGIFGGKEYLEFPPILIIPILIGWFLFAYNVIGSLLNGFTKRPVYFWMWCTGSVFMIYHLSEAYIWLTPYFKDKFLANTALQWKAGGSFVGSWNMLVYGTATYVMAKLSPTSGVGTDKKSFFFYFLGLSNLMFGWAHHVYLIPIAPWIRYFAYLVSMTEWILLISIIYSWKKSLNFNSTIENKVVIKFLSSTDKWVLINLFVALLISIPAINYYTHGTHVTVAHSMGTTIGINTTILLASIAYIVQKENPHFNFKLVLKGLTFFNIALILFLITLLVAGASRSQWMYALEPSAFAAMQYKLKTVYLIMAILGTLLTTTILVMVLPLFKGLMKALRG